MYSNAHTIRSPDRPARSQSLYRLRYTAHIVRIHITYFHVMIQAREGRVAVSAEFRDVQQPIFFVAFGLHTAGREFKF